MSDLQIRDLSEDRALDAAALRELSGGWAAFIGGLQALTLGTRLVPPLASSVTNIFVDYDQTVQLNPTNVNVLAGEGAVTTIDVLSFNIGPVNVGQDVAGN